MSHILDTPTLDLTPPVPEATQLDPSVLEKSTAEDFEQVGDEKDKTISFHFDQVNDNPDELIALRGEGRYFGVTDVATGPICSNCHRRGHIRSKCKVVVCHACGLVDDHYETQCPKSMICTNCGQKGHFKGLCQEKMRRTFCTRCESKNHSDERCPNIWRSYLLKPNREIATKLPTIFCYNCGRENHYGDDCNQYRSSKTPNVDGSGFSGNNLPKELRDLYFRRKNNNKNSSNESSSYSKKRSYYDDNEEGSDFYGEESIYESNKKRKDNFNSRSGYLNKKKEQTNYNKRQVPTAPSFPRASNSGKLPRSSNYGGNTGSRGDSGGNNRNNSRNNYKNSSNSNHKKGFLPLRGQNGNRSDKKSYHKRF